jgi:hypothetical protein
MSKNAHKGGSGMSSIRILAVPTTPVISAQTAVNCLSKYTLTIVEQHTNWYGSKPFDTQVELDQ